MNRHFISSIFFSVLFCNTSSYAQDYPYDDAPASQTKEDLDINNLPEEAPPPREKPRAMLEKKGSKTISVDGTKAQRSLFRFGLKVGGSYSIYQLRGTSDLSGAGFEGVLSFGWDLAYQPLFIELESGYKQYFASANSKMRIIPFRLGTFYRSRLGDRELWKLGAGSSLDMRIANTVPGENRSWSLVPAFFVSSTFEFGNFLVEIVPTIHRILSNETFVSFAGRVGLRF